MNEITIREYDVNFKKIIDLVLDRKNWGKVYTLFTSGELTVNCFVYDVNFQNSSMSFEIKFKYREFSDYAFAIYHMKNMTINFFEKHLYKKIKRLLEEHLELQLKDIARSKYIDLYHTKIKDEDYKKYDCEKLYEEALEMKYNLRIKILETIHKEILEIKNKDFNEKVKEYIENNEVKIPCFINVIERIKKKIGE